MDPSKLYAQLAPFLQGLFDSYFFELFIIFTLILLVFLNVYNLRKYKMHLPWGDLFYIAGINLFARKSRSVVTVLGMSIGIAAIVFLVSIGYGLQDLVISEATRLEELKHITVSTQQGSKLNLDDEALADFSNISQVQEALPMVAIVGEMSYEQSISSVPVYAVTTNYLKESAFEPIAGDVFQSEELFYTGEEASEKEAKATPVPTIVDSADSAVPSELIDVPEGEDFIELDSESLQEDSAKLEEVNLPDSALTELVINTAALDVIGIPQDEAVGKSIKLGFTVTDQFLPDDKKIISTPKEFTIVGVLQDDTATALYVPFVDLRLLGIDKFSEVRVILANQDDVTLVREQIESMGFLTTSVVDTIAEIEQLFSSLRLGLGLIGAFGLSIAALGMFNTLTVSLLERTREIGLMKTIGMKSVEIRLLFLVESLLMGILGGIIGLLLGFLGGKLLSLILSTYSLSQAGNAIDISTIPFRFVLLVVSLSFLVGYITGFFPARRATRISALDALRYE